MSLMRLPENTDVLVVGAGPAGSAAAYWSAQDGHDVVLADMARFPRDKTCGDGLTPRAIGELNQLGLEDWVLSHTRNQGLRAAGFGQVLELKWPGGSLPSYGSAIPRTELDDKLRTLAIDTGVTSVEGAKAVGAEHDTDGRVTAVIFETGPERTRRRIACKRLVVADGVRSALGKALGREWHRDTAYGVAGRAYAKTPFSDDPWISSHLELRDERGELLSGYGWIFPLGGGEVNLGVGALATAKRPAELKIRPLMEYYARLRREEWDLGDELRAPASALLPMGGAVSGVSGPNWVLVGDAAGCVNPLNGEGIDYGLETGRLAAELLDDTAHLEHAWPALLSARYGEAFSIARRLAGLLTVPRLLPTAGPVGMHSTVLMRLALRVMGNLVTEEDRDVTARLWRWAGRRSLRLDERPPFAAIGS